MNNFEIALTKRACPICGRLFDSDIIIPRKLTNATNKKVKELHGQCVGWLDKPCEKCREIIDQNAFFVIGIEADKTADFSNPYRSGHLFAIKKESDFYKGLPEEYKKKDACFMDVNDLKLCGFIKDESTDHTEAA